MADVRDDRMNRWNIRFPRLMSRKPHPEDANDKEKRAQKSQDGSIGEADREKKDEAFEARRCFGSRREINKASL
jgi:hypothetical protein